MAESLAEPESSQLFGGKIRVDRAGLSAASQTSGEVASHDGTGRRFAFEPPEASGWSYAIDAERRDQPVPEALAAVLGPEVLPRWGEIEVIAKLTNTPAHLVLRSIAADGTTEMARWRSIEISRADTASHWIAVGRRMLR